MASMVANHRSRFWTRKRKLVVSIGLFGLVVGTVLMWTSEDASKPYVLGALLAFIAVLWIAVAILGSNDKDLDRFTKSF